MNKKIEQEIRDLVSSGSEGRPVRGSSRPVARLAARTDHKSRIENQAISGMPIDGRDVAVVSRDRRTVRLRHVWPDDVDARVWHGVREAFMDLATDLARETRHPVEVYAKEGYMLEQVRPGR